MKNEDRIVKQVIKRYGAVIDLKKTPFVLIEILREHGRLFQDPDGGLPPGGVPPPPEPPPGPEDRPSIDNSVILKQILTLSREVSKLATDVKAIKERVSKR
jgi:hypothetical protein